LPALSVAVHVRVMTSPTCTSENAISISVSQSSVAVAVPVAEGSVGSPHSTMMSPGQVNTGSVESSSVIVCMQVEVRPTVSSAIHVRVMTKPSCESEKVTAGLGAQSSVAVAVPVFEGSVEAAQSIVISEGQAITGSSTSIQGQDRLARANTPLPNVPLPCVKSDSIGRSVSGPERHKRKLIGLPER